jgi:hypothetical protein
MLARVGPTTPMHPPGRLWPHVGWIGLHCCHTLFAPERPSPSARERVPPQQGHRSAVWVDEALTVLSTIFGGATAFPKGRGIWRDDAQGGKLLFDEPVVIQCYTSEPLIEQRMPALRDFLYRMGREARQGAVGLVIDDEYLEIGFPLEEAPPPRRPKGRKGRR